MNLHLTGHHLQITQAIRDHVAGKLERVTAHFDQVIDIPRPRRVDDLLDNEHFMQLEARIWKDLRDELV